MVEYEASEETDELGYNYVKIRPGDGRIYAFSEEFNLEYPETVRYWEALHKDSEKTQRNIEELQMRLNLQIEADKEKLWSDKILSEQSPYAHDMWYTDYEPWSAKRLMYSLFYDDPRCMAFSPDAIMFKS